MLLNMFMGFINWPRHCYLAGKSLTIHVTLLNRSSRCANRVRVKGYTLYCKRHKLSQTHRDTCKEKHRHDLSYVHVTKTKCTYTTQNGCSGGNRYKYNLLISCISIATSELTVVLRQKIWTPLKKDPLVLYFNILYLDSWSRYFDIFGLPWNW